MSLTVISVGLTPFQIPLRRPVKFSTGVLTSAEHVLVEVKTDDGVVGVAEAIPRPMIYGETMVSTLYAIEHLIAPQLVGRSLLDRERFSFRMRHLFGNPVAKGAVELAAFDALGKALGVSCHSLLGGFEPSVRCTAIVGAGSPESVVEQCHDLHARHGIDCFKLKVGMDLARDVETMRAVRMAFPAAVMYPDANHGFSAADALRFLDATSELGLAWIEEPCPGGEVMARERVCAHSSIPVLGDETCTDLQEVATEVLGGRCTMISIKLARTGIGISQRIRDFCEATGTGVLIGSQGDSTIGTRISASFAAATPVTARNPAELGYFLELEGDVCTEPLEVKNGLVQVSEAPGFGIDIDRERLQSYRMEV